METVYIEGDFKEYVDKCYKSGTIELLPIDGHNRWVVTGEDGVKFIVRPIEAKEVK